MGASRFAYNETVAYLKQPGTKANWKGIKTDLLHGLPEWTNLTPYQIKSIAVKDACLAVRKAKMDFKTTGVFQGVGFRSKKNPNQSLYIPKSAITQNGVYHTILGKLRMTENLPMTFGDSRLTCESGRWFLCLSYTESAAYSSENQARVVSLDPGVRTFITYYSETSCGKIGLQAFNRIHSLCRHLDDLYSRISKATGKRKYRMRRAANRLKWKIKDLIDEMHHQTAAFLCKNFDVIFLPTFDVSEMVTKAKRKIRSKTVRNMLSLAHYRFSKFLSHKARETGKIVIETNEAYTSKTVSWTGEVKKVGGSKYIKSSIDGRVMDRDYNGSRGILLRALVDTPSRQQLFASGVCIGDPDLMAAFGS